MTQLKPKNAKKPAAAHPPAPATAGRLDEHAGGAPAGMPVFLQSSAQVPANSRAGASDGAEIEADRIADKVVSADPGPHTLSRATTAAASTRGGRPLPAPARAYFEPRFGADFSGVRIHTGHEADTSARTLDAVAFTQGADIAFRDGSYSPDTSPGKRLLAHELAHVVQQSNGRRQTIQRQAAPDTSDPDTAKADNFLSYHSAPLAEELAHDTAIQMFSLGSPHLAWDGDGEVRFKEEVAGQLFPYAGGLSWSLPRFLAPVSEYRILKTIGHALIDDPSENAVPTVAFELMPLIKQRIDASLRRIVPRYLAARNQAVPASSTESQPEPAFDQIPTSTPLDAVVVSGLLSGVTRFDEAGYRESIKTNAPTDLGIKTPGDIQFLSAQGLPQWVRAANKDATAEDVAAALYGSSELAYEIVAAPPLFGINPGTLIEEPYRRLWRESLEPAGLTQLSGLAQQGFYPVASPLNSIAGSAVQDEAILGQSKTLAPTGATQMEVVQQMRLALGIADQIVVQARKFGLSHLVIDMRARLDARSKKFAGSDAASEAQAWGAQVAEQYDILNGAAAGLATAAAELKSYGDNDIPRYIQDPMHDLATAYVEAGSLSEFADAGPQKLAEAHDLSNSYASDVLDGALRYVRESLVAISSDAAEQMGGNTSALLSLEKSLRTELATVRSLIEEDPKRAVELVRSLQKKINKLSSRVSVLNTLGSIDSLTAALKKHVSNIYSTPTASAMSGSMPAPFGPNPDDWKDDAAKPYDEAIASLANFRPTWASIAKTAFAGTDEELEQQIKASAGRQKELGAVLANALQLAKDAEDYDHLFGIYQTFLIGLAIAIVTFGVGELVAGAAVAGGLAEGGAGVFVLSTTAEALTMTTINAAVSGKGWEDFGEDFLWNFATAGMMKGVARLYKGVIGAAAAETALGAAGEFTVTLLAGTLPALAKAEYDTKKQLGRDLTDAEAHAVVRDSILQGLALAIGMRVAGEFLPNFRAAGAKFGARIKSINQARITIHGEAQTLGKARVVDEKAIQDLTAKDTALLEQEIKLVDEAGAAADLSEGEKADLDLAKRVAAAATDAAGVRKVLPYLEDAGENQLLCAQGHMEDVKAFYSQPHAPAAPEAAASAATAPAPVPAPAPPAVMELPPDEVTHARRIEVLPSDGTEPFTVTEKVTAGTETVVASAKPESSTQPPEATPGKYKTLDDILTQDRKGFTDNGVQGKYDEYVKIKNKQGEPPASPEEWALTWTRGSGEAALEKLLGPDFRAQGDAAHLVELENYGRPAGLTDEKLASLWARISSRQGQFRTKLRNMIAKGISLGKVNVGYFYNCKGLVAEILSEGFQQSVLAERQQANPDARLYNDVYVVRGGEGDPVLFTDGLIGHADGSDLAITDRFEVKSGASGGEQAARQFHKWVESHMENGTKLLLNKRPASPGEMPAAGSGQERIGNMIYDAYYWRPTRGQFGKQPQLRRVTGLSGAGTLHSIMPEGGTVLSAESGDHTVPIQVHELPATASEINYLARLMIEQVTAPPTGPAPTPDPGASAAQ